MSEHRAALLAVIDVLQELRDGAEASTSRDFGRGVAHAAGRIQTALSDALLDTTGAPS